MIRRKESEEITHDIININQVLKRWTIGDNQAVKINGRRIKTATMKREFQTQMNTVTVSISICWPPGRSFVTCFRKGITIDHIPLEKCASASVKVETKARVVNES